MSEICALADCTERFEDRGRGRAQRYCSVEHRDRAAYERRRGLTEARQYQEEQRPAKEVEDLPSWMQMTPQPVAEIHQVAAFGDYLPCECRSPGAHV